MKPQNKSRDASTNIPFLLGWWLFLEFCKCGGFLHIRQFWNITVLCLVAQSCPTLCDPIEEPNRLLCNPNDGSLTGSSVHGDSPGKNIGVGCHVLLQGIFPIQGSNPDLLPCRWILYYLSHKESPRILEWGAYLFFRGCSQHRNWTKVSYFSRR